MFQSRTGFPGHLAPTKFSASCSLSAFQSRTGFPGHLASHQSRAGGRPGNGFQSRTGFPGHLAVTLALGRCEDIFVSIPNGLPRPFSRQIFDFLRRMRFFVSIPNGLPRPFSPDIQPFMQQLTKVFQSRTGFPGHLAL